LHRPNIYSDFYAVETKVRLGADEKRLNISTIVRTLMHVLVTSYRRPDVFGLWAEPSGIHTPGLPRLKRKIR
jgi:hypothetical protein